MKVPPLAPGLLPECPARKVFLPISASRLPEKLFGPAALFFRVPDEQAGIALSDSESGQDKRITRIMTPSR